MKRSGIVAALIVLSVGTTQPVAGFAQAATRKPAIQSSTPLPSDLSGNSYKTRPIPQVEVLAPFAADASAATNKNPLEFRTQDQISKSDSALLRSASTSIRAKAELDGMDFDQGTWNYEQLNCSALPDHLFLIFKRNNGSRDVSIFSAAIPRTGNGRVRIIPIERRGYSLFSPAAVNTLTIGEFNRIRAEEPKSRLADWLACSLCYAALTGVKPVVTAPLVKLGMADLGLIFPPTLEVGPNGSEIVRFVDTASERPTQWVLAFSRRGELLNVEHFVTPTFVTKPIAPK
jgi:hypothetical protein